MSERRCAEGSLEMAFKRVTLSWGGRMRDASQSKDFVVNVCLPDLPTFCRTEGERRQ